MHHSRFEPYWVDQLGAALLGTPTIPPRPTDPDTFSRGTDGLQEMTEITPTTAIPREHEGAYLRSSVSADGTTDGADSVASLMQPEVDPSRKASDQEQAFGERQLPSGSMGQEGLCGQLGSQVGQTAPASDLDWSELTPKGLYASYGKRVFNSVLLVAVLPFAVLIALPVALINWAQFGQLSQIFYCQPRVGRRGKTFSIFKFRTMREAPLDDFDSWSEGQDRLRVTTFGRLLRNTHLDELPQLLNILRGEMDFIGPRPEMVEIDRWACANVEGFRKRNALLPGITGYAQITQGYAGKDAEAYAMKLAGDEIYRGHMSLVQDILILLRTGVWMIRGRGWRFAPAKTSAGSTERPSGKAPSSGFVTETDRQRVDDESADEMSGTSAA